MILAELKALREEVAELRQTMRLIEYKPELAQPDTAESVPDNQPLPWWRRPIFPRKG
ncbi:hypothetical protein D3C76_1536320 [compost metagenome]